MAYKEKTYPIETVCVGYFDTGKRYKDGPLKGKRILGKSVRNKCCNYD